MGLRIGRSLFPGLYLIIVKNYTTIILPNNSPNPAHPIAVAQVKPQLKYQMWLVLPFKLIAIHRFKRVCLTWGLTRGTSTHTCLAWGFTRGCRTYTCLTCFTKYRTTTEQLPKSWYIASITLLTYIPASFVAPIALIQFSVASINSD